VPETYLIDKKGVIRYKRIGPLTPEIVKNTLLPLVKELERARTPALLLAALLAAPLAAKEAAPAAADPVLEKRVMALAEELRCLVCQNQTLAESNAPARRGPEEPGARKNARRQERPAEVVDFLVERYGDFVLYRPPLKATTVLLWFGPLLLLAAGFAVLLRRVQRRRGAVESGVSEANHKRAAELLAGDER